MRVEDRVRLQHMIEAAQSAIQFVSGRERSELDTNRMLLFALVRAIEIVGRRQARFPNKPALPLAGFHKAIIGMRNRLIHAYFEIDHQIV